MTLDFSVFKEAVEQQIQEMFKIGKLYRAKVDKTEIFNLYLASFPEGTNPIFRERTEHDCNCCKNFIRNFGNAVVIKDEKLVSVWDIKPTGTAYDTVAAALSEYVKSCGIENQYLVGERSYGSRRNYDNHTEQPWDHFYVDVPSEYVIKPKERIGSLLANHSSTYNVFYRGVAEITQDAIETVINLINENAIYRGAEFLASVKEFHKLWKQANKLPSDNAKQLFCWANITNPNARLRNTVIGTLLTDLSDGVDIEIAVASYESKVAPENYKRTTALVTKKMIKDAQETAKNLDLIEALPRRFAVATDLTINNVLFADRSATAAMDGEDIFADLIKTTSTTTTLPKKVQTVSIDDFIKNVMPNHTSLELFFENRLQQNLMSLIAPVNKDVKQLFKWGNNFSWAYNGDVTDSMLKERVKSAGGKVDGVLRFSLQWNEDNRDSNIDLDAHCKEPEGGRLISFSNMQNPRTGGNLDVDNTRPGNKIAVENITWPEKGKMLDGDYQFFVHNFSNSQCNAGFTAEIEFDGEIHSFSYPKIIRGREKVLVATVNLRNGVFTIKPKINSSTASKDIWNVKTQEYRRVSMVMNSPNHWDGEETGNKHYFFILEGCKTPDSARGFFNEYLRNDLTKHRKVFEILGNQTKAEPTDDQLSGLGFSSTKSNNVYIRLDGKKVLNVTF